MSYLNRLELSILHDGIDCVCTCLPNSVFPEYSNCLLDLYISSNEHSKSHSKCSINFNWEWGITGWNRVASKIKTLVPLGNHCQIFSDKFLFLPYFQILMFISCPWWKQACPLHYLKVHENEDRPFEEHLVQGNFLISHLSSNVILGILFTYLTLS